MIKHFLVAGIIVVSLVVMAIFVSGTVQARDVADEGLARPHINCCLQDGQCLKTRKDNCALKKGIVVQDCSECPGVWGQGKKEK
ncbi:hypothetical protein [Desulfomonile tiedjei]|uniref:Uncharacterized protein n=1 Tax=Desulfomonile tiedjei (strain ATCC 49306 / DSM 6799 / DCB-1) TaxID=706587 RepID=I4C5E5_DESTA|nr:hypothetical protein [Desulfomonile tiedjei]AFM24786.1 hypothetical protein Desti_2085 [Desulfomonile tiedjei DSM 6799]